MTAPTTRALRIERRIRAPAAQVFDAWTRPELVRRWACPVPGGVHAWESDLRVGGRYRLEMRVDGAVHVAYGRYLEIDRPRRVVYTWDWASEEEAMGETRVSVDFRADGDETVVTLVHQGFPDDGSRDGHAQGWAACMDQFEAVASAPAP